MTVDPWLFEALVVTVMGLSGIGLGVMVGWRHPLLLAAMAVLVATFVRVITALGTWSLGQYGFLQEAWWTTSAVLAAGGVIAGFLFARRDYVVALGIYAALGASSLAVKYVFQIGERHHRDSSSTVETALLVFQRELEPREWEPSEKRGLAYPLMLALGPDERMLSAVTPLIFFSLLVLSWWLAREFLRGRVPLRWQMVAGVAVLAFSLTVPIFRVSLTYLNSHTLMALALLAMVAGYFLSEREGRVTPETATLMVVGSLIGSTARVEGIVFVAVVLAAIVSGKSVTGKTGRFGVFSAVAISGSSLAWWLHLIGSDVPDQFGVDALFVALATTTAAAIAVVPLLDKVRWLFFPLAAAIIAGVIISVSLSASNPLDPFMGLFNNVVRGYGGWGVAASALGASLLLLGWRARSWQYRKLASLLVLTIFAALFAKLFDGGEFGGGFGRDSFYDSANRMWLHTLGIAISAMVIGFAEFMHDVSHRLRAVRHKKTPPDDYTSTTVSVSKDSQP